MTKESRPEGVCSALRDVRDSWALLESEVVLDATHDASQCRQFLFEGLAASPRQRDPGAAAATLGLAYETDQTRLLENLKVATQIAVGQGELSLQVAEVRSHQSAERGENPKTYALVDVVVEFMNRMLLRSLSFSLLPAPFCLPNPTAGSSAPTIP